MEKRGERKEGVPVLALAKCLLASYVLTLLLLCLLALLLYKLHLTEGMVTIAISAIYVVTTFMAGFLAGKNYKKLPGTPDIAITKYKIAIFCDSEFFHGYNWEIKKQKLGHNREY